MSTKTFFKRISLGVVVALGFGMMSAPSSSATLLTKSISLSSSTATAVIGDTATVTATVRFSGNDADNKQTPTAGTQDSVTLRYTCDAPTGATCPTLAYRQNQLSDTANVTTKPTANMDKFVTLANGATDSLTSTTATGRATYMISTNGANAGSAIGSAFATAGTYTYNFYLTGSGASNVLTLDSGATLVSWTVTVTAPSTNATGGSAPCTSPATPTRRCSTMLIGSMVRVPQILQSRHQRERLLLQRRSVMPTSTCSMQQVILG